MPERDARERAADFDEVALGYSEELARAEAMRCLQCKNATCIEGCPVNIDIKSFIGHIIDGDYADGVAVLKERNALPAVCGRVCPQEEQCEIACVLAKKGEPVAIGRLERFLGDYDLACDSTSAAFPRSPRRAGFAARSWARAPRGSRARASWHASATR
jgi:glutamate synthase (NADPH) small chain